MLLALYESLGWGDVGERVESVQGGCKLSCWCGRACGSGSVSLDWLMIGYQAAAAEAASTSQTAEPFSLHLETEMVVAQRVAMPTSESTRLYRNLFRPVTLGTSPSTITNHKAWIVNHKS